MSNRARLRSPDRFSTRARVELGERLGVSVHRLRESATAVADADTVVEESTAPPVTFTQITIAEASTGTMTSSGGRRYKARLIEGDRWGSSGYYPRKVVERDGPKVFPSGTQMYLNHPTDTEEAERPERDVRDLAAQLVTTPVYEGDGLYATIEVFPHALPLIESIGDKIGLSIRGGGTADFGTIAGRTGPIIESLTHGESVDFVTRAGAGGKLVSLAEAARLNPKISEAVKRTLGAYLEAQLHLAFTQMADDMYGHGRLSREERITLSSAIGDGLAAFTTKVEAEAPQLFQRDIWDGPADDAAATATTESTRLREASNNDIQAALDTAVRTAYGDDGDVTQWIYVCDFDADAHTAWYAISDNQSRTTWQQSYSLTTGDAATVATLADDRIQVVPRTEYVPVPPSDAAAADTDGDADTDADVTESATPTQQAATTPPTSVTDGAPPAAPNPPEEETGMSGTQNTGPVPGAAGTTDTAVSTAVTEAQTARAEAETKLAESERKNADAERRLARFEATDVARPIASTMLAESQLPAAAQARVLSSVTANVPLTEANVLDEAAFRTAVTEATTAEETYLASVRESAGEGRVSGLGAGGGTETTPEQRTAAREGKFRALGMSESAAKIAANGRIGGRV